MIIKKRDKNILKAYQREINLKPRIKQSKKVYSRKIKHKNKGYEEWNT